MNDYTAVFIASMVVLLLLLAVFLTTLTKAIKLTRKI